jgi:cytochrome c
MDSFELSKMVGAVLAALLLIVGSNVIVGARTAESPGQPANGYKLPTDTASAEPAPAEAAPAESAEVPSAKPTAPAPAAPAKEGAASAPAKVAAAPASAPAAPAAAPAAPAAAPAAAAPATAPAAPGGFDAKAVVAQVASAKPDDGAAIFKKCAACHVVKKDAPSGAAPNLWGIVNRPKASQPDFAAKYSDAMKAKGGDWTYENLAQFIHQPKGYVAGTKMAFAGIKDPAEIANVIAYLRTLADAPAPLPK